MVAGSAPPRAFKDGDVLAAKRSHRAFLRNSFAQEIGYDLRISGIRNRRLVDEHTRRIAASVPSRPALL